MFTSIISVTSKLSNTRQGSGWGWGLIEVWTFTSLPEVFPAAPYFASSTAHLSSPACQAAQSHQAVVQILTSHLLERGTPLRMLAAASRCPSPLPGHQQTDRCHWKTARYRTTLWYQNIKVNGNAPAWSVHQQIATKRPKWSYKQLQITWAPFWGKSIFWSLIDTGQETGHRPPGNHKSLGNKVHSSTPTMNFSYLVVDGCCKDLSFELSLVSNLGQDALPSVTVCLIIWHCYTVCVP